MFRFLRRRTQPVKRVTPVVVKPVTPGEVTIDFTFTPTQAKTYIEFVKELRPDITDVIGQLNAEDTFNLRYTLSTARESFIKADSSLRNCAALLRDPDVSHDVNVVVLEDTIMLLRGIITRLEEIRETCVD